jgi:hypothetical protein
MLSFVARALLSAVALDHQFEFLILEFADFIFVPLNFVANRLKLIILPGLILLRFQPRDAFGTCAHIEFQSFALNFDLTPFLFQRFNARRGCGQLRFKMSAFQRQRLNLSLDLLDLLLSILENEQLFQFRIHERSTY